MISHEIFHRMLGDSDDSGWDKIKRAAVYVGVVVLIMAVAAFLLMAFNPA